MPASTVTGLLIGICFLAISLLIRIFPINNKWLYTLYTKEQRSEANRYLSSLLLLFGFGFCIVASLPLLIDFRGLRSESFIVLAVLTLNLSWHLCKRHVSKKYNQRHI